ncbi:DUF423 domain-containing protein [Stieleria sp. TO1_6]|uniref:DUF423 domain-containing protein n=1 Tax=Stieleria tagensis TaxID=2956795 RepID=UPI00209A63F0|nr:DUF423 domain-containing protein [Stieleria tagensis]MCO8124425.1 DUF423 domain-containing protein [Stieleria tagensis]
MTAVSNGWLWVAAAIAGASGVGIGAFGAHLLPDFLAGQSSDPLWMAKRLAQFETAAKYHLIHAVALLALAAAQGARPVWQRRAGILFCAGIILFSGSLYLLVLTDTPWLGAVTPLGGLSWIVAWSLLLCCRPGHCDGSGQHNL